jgi:Fe-S cluster assembly protein SufD
VKGRVEEDAPEHFEMSRVMDQPRSNHVLNFSLLREQVNGASPSWLDELRRASMGRFESVGFPSSTDEEWRFTNIQPIVKTAFELASPTGQSAGQAASAAAPSVREFTFADASRIELVFVNGTISLELSRLTDLPRGVKIGSLADAIANDGARLERILGRHADIERNPFVALNTGFIRDGAYVHLPRNTTVEGAIHLLFVSTGGGSPTVTHPRVLIVAEDNVEAQIVESYVGPRDPRNLPSPYFTNAVTEIVLGDDCRIDHCKLQQESLSAYHVATMQVHLGRQTSFVSHSVTLGGRLTRNDLNCLMAGERAYATLNGLVLIGGDQHCDNHTLLDHAQPNCPSHELYKHVLDGKSSGVFKGKILVRQVAQKTDSKQTSKSLLLSDDASMNSQPALEIYADDVKCTHGSTTGPVDEDMVFYLRTRGVSLEAARHLLTYAFAADLTRRIKVAPVRVRIEDYMAAQHGLPQDLRITDLGAFDEKVGV